MTTNSVAGQFEGAEELRAKLKEVSRDVQFKGGRFALRKASEPIRDAAIGNFQRVNRERSPEAIWRNVAVRFAPKVFAARGDLQFRIGIRGGARSRQANARNPGGDTFYWRFLEFGTENTPAQGLIREAMKRGERRVVPIFIREYRKALDRAIRRAKR